ncbi:MAG: hypothetical protein ABH804_02940 [archaeon]
MGDVLCTAMGVLDILAGVLIIFGFGINFFAVIIGLLMIGKGVFSFL